MQITNQSLTLLGLFAGFSLFPLARLVLKRRFFFDSYLTYTWVLLLSITIAEIFSFSSGLWILALVSFLALREYLSLIDVRLQDRLGILGAYLAIPFMYYFIQIDWYGMFIISIPVYAFLAVPLLVTLGGKETEGTVFSIGAIDFGLFLFVYCLGHLGYLLSYSVWLPVMLVLNVLLCDLVARIIRSRAWTPALDLAGRLLIPLPLTIGVSRILAVWTGLPSTHSLVLGAIIPPLVVMGQRTGDYIKADLGISGDNLFPGRGRILDNLKSFFFAAPVVFHYLRYFLK